MTITLKATNGAKEDLPIMERRLANGFTLRCVVRLWSNDKDKPSGPTWDLTHKRLERPLPLTEQTALALILEIKGK